MQANSRSYAVVTRAGERISGRLLNQDAFSVQLLDSDARLRSFVKDELQQYDFIESQMPSLQETFSAQEVADLVQYLASLRGVP